jgi:hypothetical protein
VFKAIWKRYEHATVVQVGKHHRRKRGREHPPSAEPVLLADAAQSPAGSSGSERVNDAVAWHIDKGALTLSEPRRYRNRAHLEFVSSQPCLLCGRRPSDAHHLRFVQPRAMGRRVSDEFAVPLCRTHHRILHARGDEAAWWEELKLDPVMVARQLWEHTRLSEGHGNRGIGASLHGAMETSDRNTEGADQPVDGAGSPTASPVGLPSR